MTKFTIIEPDELKMILRQEIELLQESKQKPTFEQNGELPISLKEAAEQTGVSSKTFENLIRQRILPRRQFVKGGKLMLYPSDIKNALERKKSG